MLDQKRPDAELGREAFCQFVVRQHDALEVVQSAVGDDVRVRQIEERHQAVAFRCWKLRSQGNDQQRSHIIEVGWQLFAERPRDVLCLRGQFEIVQASRGSSSKPLRVKFGTHGGERFRDERDQLTAHQLLKRYTVLNRGRSGKSLSRVNHGCSSRCPKSCCVSSSFGFCGANFQTRRSRAG